MNTRIRLSNGDTLIVREEDQFTVEEIAMAIAQWDAEELADRHGFTEEELVQIEAQLG